MGSRRKSIPVDSLLQLRQRLDRLPPKSPERATQIAAIAQLYSVSVTTVYRALHFALKPRSVHRCDHGIPRVLPQPELEHYCELIAALKLRTTNKSGRHLSTERTIQLLEEYGVQTEQGVVPMFREQPKPWLLELQEEMEKRMERERAYSARFREKIEKVWNECLPFSSHVTEPMRLYFKNRELLFKVDEVEKSDSLRFNPAMSYYDEDGNEVGKFPTIVCAIRDIEGNLVTLHRIYLTQNGKKAKVGNAKKMVPIPEGLDVNGAAIRLGEPTEGILGVAEGLETALSAYRVTQIPVWSTVNATLMESFEVPEGVHTVLIWADKDKSVTGEKSANMLKAKLEKRGTRVYVLLPKLPIPPRAKGIDWNDVLMSQGSLGFPNARYLRDFIARRRAEYDRH
ncbi:DUF7146 domain-containing protein [Xenorhabdus miraniensis]|uniref:DNA primase n=1 Tax=Xenorhabdus miraniensis TaxID=351674 RepID=A0A2D0JJI4_9GAMM|nr:toprim domain-containing protein [Xenorhabdus miraniensis]PHM45586.1 DNA primase [Xenorhabdus miraniensis]